VIVHGRADPVVPTPPARSAVIMHAERTVLSTWWPGQAAAGLAAHDRSAGVDRGCNHARRGCVEPYV